MAADRSPLAWGPLCVVALAYVVLQAAVADRHGFHRDELYFLEAGRHLALGYVDQPPLVALLARAQSAVFGPSPWALRVVPMLVGAGSVLMAGALARELGGTRQAQTWAAAALASAGLVLTWGHLLSTGTIDFAFWLALLLVVTRMLRTGDPRLWVLYGVVAGAALWNKHLPVLLTVALLLALAADRRWELLRTRWLVVGGAVAAVLIAPHVIWQASHGWPQLEMASALSDRIGTENRITLLPLQLLMLGPPLIPLAVAGIRWFVRDGTTFRPLLWAYAAALGLTFLSGGRPYYPLALAAAVVVAGAVALADRPASATTRTVPALIGINLVLALPLSLPVLPVDVLAESPIGEVNDTLVEQVGWPALAQQVADVVADLPSAEAERAIVLTGTYGEAGALDRYGPEAALPTVYSGHNGYWSWRRPTDDAATVVAVRLSPAFLDEHFRTCTPAGTVDNGMGVDNEVRGAPITVCRGLRGTWAQRWPEFRHVS